MKKRVFKTYDLLFMAAVVMALAALLAYLNPANTAATLHGWERIWSTWTAWAWLLLH